MQIIKEILFSILIGSIIAALTIFTTVNAFAAELPDIEEPCGLSEEELRSRLKGELKNYAKEFLQAEADYEINALLIASIAAAESGWGEHQFRPNNIFGFGKKEFEDIPSCIDFVSWYLRKNYLNEWGKYYRGGTIADIGKIWCPDDGEWVQLVTGIYGGLCR